MAAADVSDTGMGLRGDTPTGDGFAGKHVTALWADGSGLLPGNAPGTPIVIQEKLIGRWVILKFQIRAIPVQRVAGAYRNVAQMSIDRG